jgi:hypothetical protein
LNRDTLYGIRRRRERAPPFQEVPASERTKNETEAHKEIDENRRKDKGIEERVCVADRPIYKGDTTIDVTAQVWNEEGGYRIE